MSHSNKPSKEDAEEAVRTLIRWLGDDPSREGLQDTPTRMTESFTEFFQGYHEDPVAHLEHSFEEIEGYDQIVLLKNIRFESYCEHHIVPIYGTAHVAYIPDKRLVGISKLGRVVDIFAKRLQIQEKMTVQIATTLYDVLKPKGVAVVLEASHHCITSRGVYKPDALLQTSHLLGRFREDSRTRSEFFQLLQLPQHRNLY
jgi:GTP cyclohydrolase I